MTEYESSLPLFPDLLDQWSDYRNTGPGSHLNRHKMWSIGNMANRILKNGEMDLRALAVDWEGPGTFYVDDDHVNTDARFAVRVSHCINRWVEAGKKRELKQRFREVSRHFDRRADAVAMATKILDVMERVVNHKRECAQ